VLPLKETAIFAVSFPWVKKKAPIIPTRKIEETRMRKTARMLCTALLIVTSF
jgi:hypothetical protein